MWEQMNDEQKVISYLLGALSETEAERLDELSVTDQEFAERLRRIEDELVDAYVRGELTGDWLDRFKAHYLASPLRREKVRFAQALLGYTDRAATAEVMTMAAVPASA